MLILRLRKPQDPQVVSLTLLADYTLHEVQDLINQAIEAETALVLLAVDGAFIELDTSEYARPPGLISVADSSLGKDGK